MILCVHFIQKVPANIEILMQSETVDVLLCGGQRLNGILITVVMGKLSVPERMTDDFEVTGTGRFIICHTFCPSRRGIATNDLVARFVDV